MNTSSSINRHRFWYYFSEKRYLLVLTLFSLFSFVESGFATDYYFSTTEGNDSRSVSQAQNSSTPWKSIDKLNSIASTLKGGDRILFKSGETFYGSIKITKSGSSGAPILFSSYGTGAKPIITSLVKISNLIAVGGGKYEANLSTYGIKRMQIALVNDQIKEVGRYPNTGTADGGYLRISNVNSSNSISTASSNPFSGSTGDVVIRKNNWIIDRHAISSIGGNSISFMSNESHYIPEKNYGYFLQNHASLLDVPGEWSYDPNSKKFTVNLTGFNLSTVNVSVATLDNLVTNNPYTTNLSFSNLHFKGANNHLLNITKSENVKIENCLLEYAGLNAIASSEIRSFVIQNNQINYSLNSAISVSYGSPGAIVRGNSINYTFPFQGMARESDLSGIGIYIASDSDGSLIEKNNLLNSGFNAIHFGGSYTKVVNNYIDNFCLYKQDGGGIYTNSDGLKDRNNVGREITGNIILNGKGTKFGTTEEVDMAEGIYLDDNSAGVKVSKNTVAFVTGKGLYLHNANNIEISENLFYKAKNQVQLTHDFMGGAIRNINVTKNLFSSIDKTQQVYSIYSSENDIGSVGSFSSNYFLDPFNNDFFILTKGASDGPIGVSRNLSNWASSFGYDGNYQKPELNISTYKITSSSLIKESTFASNTAIISGVYGAGSQLASSGISGGTLKLTPNSSSNATTYIQIGAVNPGEKILVEFDLKGTPANIPVELFLEGTYNLNPGAANAKVSTTSAVKSNKVILDSKVSKSTESIVLRFPPSASELLLDNIKISKVTVENIDESSLIFFAHNPTATAVQKPLDGTYKNAKNETFSSSVSIPAYGSVLLAKISAVTTPVANQAPTVTLSKPTQGQIFIQGVNPVELVANAQDPEGKIKKVDFYQGTTLLKSVIAPPYSYSWSTIQNGDYQVYAKVTDEGNLTATSPTVNFTVKSAGTPAPSYTATMLSPINNSTIVQGSQSVILKTNAVSSGIAVQKIEFFNWGFPLTTVTDGNFELDWKTVDVDSYSITAKITDKNGNTYATAPIKFTVKAPTTLPVSLGINLSQPSNNQVFTLGQQSVKLKANTTGSTPIKSVQFYNWGYPLMSTAASPYEFDWTKIQAGNYQIYAVVTDVNGKTATSQTVKFQVVAGNSILETAKPSAPITIQMAAPYNNQVFELGKNSIVLKANTSQPVSKVEFFNWYVPLVSVTNSANEFQWSKIEIGEYLISARITDASGVVTESSAVRFTVVSPKFRTNEGDSTSANNPEIVAITPDPIVPEIKNESIPEDDAPRYGIKMGPNPTSSHLNIFFEDYPENLDGQVSVLDLRGVGLYQADFNTDEKTITLDLSFLKPGIYVVRLNFGNKSFQSHKLIKT